MKKFAGTKSLITIKRQCFDAGLHLNDYMYEVHGWDTIRIDCPTGAYVIFNTFNGRFYGKTDRGVEFDSSSTKHERRRWFQTLLDFFYEGRK